MKQPTKISIVIATYRRPAMLRDSVLSLRSLNIPSNVSLEVLVVDNDPGESAAGVMEELADRCVGAFALRYVAEPLTGLSHARNRGIEEADGDVIGFLDDDIFISESWLVAMLDCLHRTGAASVGGPYLNHWEQEPDPTVRACEYKLVTPNWGERDHAFHGRSTPGGGNAVFRRHVFDAGLRFSPELGRIGNLLLSGEDTELFRRLQKQGDAVWYCASAAIRHRIGGERLTQDYLIRRSFWFGYSYAIIDRRVDGRFTQLTRALARLGKLSLVDTVRLAWTWLRRDAARKLIARCSLATQWGYLRATFFPLPMTDDAPPRAATPRANRQPSETPTVSS
jgi:glycosyltransferase involved in cell wall biosynthesis